MGTDRSHYDVLGVSRDADSTSIREAYRARARRHHPDVAGALPTDVRAMADINRAWNVLSDPARRREYDLTLAGPHSRPGVRAGATGAATRDEREQSRSPLPPARVPWRMLTVLAFVGIVFVIVADATSSPESPARPDQLIQSGSCVVIDERSDAVEVSCSQAHDGVVRQLVAFDRTCPFDTEPHRDRQGMGLACIDRSSGTP